MYPEEDPPAAERLTMFLEQYWGGPTTYSERRGHPRLRMRHMPFHVNPDARDRWLRTCAPRSTSRPPLHEATLWDYLAARRACDGEHVRTDGIGPERTPTASDATGPP
jgi:hemoglobin